MIDKPYDDDFSITAHDFFAQLLVPSKVPLQTMADGGVEVLHALLLPCQCNLVPPRSLVVEQKGFVGRSIARYIFSEWQSRMYCTGCELNWDG